MRQGNSIKMDLGERDHGDVKWNESAQYHNGRL
jgi:hypothetical protein